MDDSSFLTRPTTLSLRSSDWTSVKSLPEYTRTGALLSSGVSLI